MKKRFTTYFQSPLGIVEITGTDTHIASVNFVIDEGESSESLPEIMVQCQKELKEYFAGERKEFSIKTKAEGTDFQKTVWKQLIAIKYGETKSYGDIAKQMKDINASRAVGHANGKNPIAIIVPCHRVIGESGKLTGYAGGMWRKQWLLDLEGNISGRNPTLF
ncbi:MAG: methylated-DNA--[protein]-cysteine S-methyltransferase [Bacteroidota bacterium]